MNSLQKIINRIKDILITNNFLFKNEENLVHMNYEYIQKTRTKNFEINFSDINQYPIQIYELNSYYKEKEQLKIKIIDDSKDIKNNLSNIELHIPIKYNTIINRDSFILQQNMQIYSDSLPIQINYKNDNITYLVLLIKRIENLYIITFNYKYEIYNSLTFISCGNKNTIQLKKVGNPNIDKIYYDIGQGWKKYKNEEKITLENNKTIQFRNANDKLSLNEQNYVYFKLKGEFKISGNIQSMINYQDCCTNYCFYKLFSNISGIKDYSQLKLPVQILNPYCYSHMFEGCTSLIRAPELPAIKLAYGCYNNMFKDCQNLNQLSAYFKEWSTIQYTKDWLENVALTGTFIKSDDLKIPEIRTNSTIPKDWTIITGRLEYYK